MKRAVLYQKGLVSVVVPCYNYGAFIADTIVSLLSQTYENWEAIVVDDGSLDDTRDRVAALMREDSRVSYVYQLNQGVSAARNTGVSHAQGEFLLFLDADDLLTNSKLQSHVEHFFRRPEVSISYSGYRFFSDSRRGDFFTNYKLDSVKEKEQLFFGRGKDVFPLFIRKNPLPIHAVVFRRSVLQRVGGFESGMRALEDWDFMLRCIMRGAFIEPLNDSSAKALIRVHSGSATRNIFFSEYMGRVYENAWAEIENLRLNSNGELADFYEECYLKAQNDLRRRRVRREKKSRRLEMMDVISEIGFFDFVRLYPLCKKWRFDFFSAYFKAAYKKISLYWL